MRRTSLLFAWRRSRLLRTGTFSSSRARNMFHSTSATSFRESRPLCRPPVPLTLTARLRRPSTQYSLDPIPTSPGRTSPGGTIGRCELNHQEVWCPLAASRSRRLDSMSQSNAPPKPLSRRLRLEEALLVRGRTAGALPHLLVVKPGGDLGRVPLMVQLKQPINKLPLDGRTHGVPRLAPGLVMAVVELGDQVVPPVRPAHSLIDHLVNLAKLHD